MNKSLFRMVTFFALFTNILLDAADFDYRGRVNFTFDKERIFDGEDFMLFENGNEKNIDSIDWRCTGAPSPLDQSVTLVGAEKKFSAKDSVMAIEDGFKATFDFTVDNPHPAGNSILIHVTIPKTFFAFIPAEGPRSIAEFKDGKAVVKGPYYSYEIDTGLSETPIAHRDIIDFRNVGWTDCFRMDLRTAEFKGNKAKVVLKVTRKVNQELARATADSPFIPLPLQNVFTRSLSDEIENDGKGGWTDQGTNDMSCLKPGVIQAQGIPFEIGDGAIILRGKARHAFPLHSKDIAVNRKVERLAFCHTAAWCEFMVPGFFYRVTYADKSTIDVPVYGGQDVADWAGLLPPNARVKSAWSGNNSEHAVHLAHFQWKNPKPEIPVESIQVVSADIATVPIVLAVTAVRQDKADDGLLTFLNNEYAKIDSGVFSLNKEKPDWYEGGLDASCTIEPGSALDVSFLLHQPAGKFGFVKRVGNHFEFENKPGQRVTFWGTNVQGAGPEKKFVPAIVDRLKKSGINVVRIHQWMQYFYHQSCEVESARSFIRKDGSVNMERLDDLFYFIAELKKNGLYIYMDTIASYNGNWLQGGDELHYVKSANDRVKEIAKLVLTTVNPYTGLALIDDPAFAMCEIHNEFSAGYQGTVETHSPEAQKTMQAWWTQWQQEHGIENPVPQKGGPVEGNGEEGRRFYTNVQQKFLEDWYNFLREVGVKVPISGTNLLLTAGDLISSRNMDFMEDHVYYGASPCATGGYWIPNNASTVNAPLRGNPVIGEIIHSRVHDKPIVCTEWSYAYPHQFREEGYPFVSAFTAYQAVDGMFSFDWAGAYTDNISSLASKKSPIVCLSQVSDPSSWGLNQAAAVAFLRVDITPARNEIVLKYTDDDIWQNRRQHPLGVAYLLQMGKVSIRLPESKSVKPSWPYGTGMDADTLFADAAKRLGIETGRDYIVSDTKELIRFSEPGLLLVDTPRSQFAAGALNSLGTVPRRRLSAFDIVSSMPFATMTFTSLDHEPLKQSSRILLCAVGNSANSTSSIDASGYHESGALPILSEPFYASITSEAVPGKNLKVYRLEPSTGKRLGELKVTRANGKERFSLDQDTKTMYLELIRESF